MKAAFVRAPGPAESIEYGDLPDPKVSGREVLVRMGAVSVNPVDTYTRGGLMEWELPMPFVVGCDIAGTVEAVGPETTRFKVGDRVWGSNQGLLGRQGTFSELAAIDEEWLYATPESVSDEDAAAGSLVGITAHLGLELRAGLKTGEKLFVVGGTGGVGSSVVQMAKAMGAVVSCCNGSDEKCEMAKGLGADDAFNYKTTSIADGVKAFAPGGLDVYWETRREPDFEMVMELMAHRGRVVVMAGRAAVVPFPVGPFYFRECSMVGFVMFRCTPDEQRACADDINRWLVGGQFKPRIDRVMDLSEAAEAHRLQEAATVGGDGGVAGKIVLRP
ncbi:MAG: NADPH:quinone reductase [Verrucomicrobiota bacterium]